MAFKEPPLPLSTTLLADNDLTATDRTKIQALLTTAFPDYAGLWVEHDSWAGPLDYRVLLRDVSGRLAGHLGFGRRWVEIGEARFLIAGIGTVAILPELQGQGIGRHLLSELKAILHNDVPVDFGFLQCRNAVVGFYERTGFTCIPQTVRSFDPGQRRWQVDASPALILPVEASLASWPQEGLLDLMGMPW